MLRLWEKIFLDGGCFVMLQHVKVGDCFFNSRTLGMLRVRAVHGEWADYLSWRPDGTRASNKGKVKVKNLTLLPYFRAESVTVCAAGQQFGFGLTPESTV
jgi:hypothetical protein